MLQNRLDTISRFVPNGAMVLDIGTDHAYLSIELVKKNIAKRVIATEKNQGPFLVARENILKASLEAYIQVRCGDGLDVIKSGEGNTLIIAGMGGITIIDILQRGQEIIEKDIEYLILQPMNASDKLREWLFKKNLVIADEELVEDKNVIYEVLYIKKTAESLLKYSGNLIKEEEIDFEIGQVLYAKKHPLFKKYLKQKCLKLKKIITSIEKSFKKENIQKLEIFKAKVYKMEKLINE